MKKVAFFQSGVIGNILVAGFIWIYDIFIKPAVYRPEDFDNFFNKQGFNSPVLGFALLTALIAESVALVFVHIHISQKQYKKMIDPDAVSDVNAVKRKSGKDGTKGERLFVVFTLLHTVMCVLGTMIMLGAFNLTPKSNELVSVGVVTLMILRELVLWVLVINSFEPPLKKPPELFRGSRIVATVLLTYFCCVMYTVIWNPLVPGFIDMIKMYAHIQDVMNLIAAIIGAVCFILLCFIMYMPIRLGFYWEESMVERTPQEKRAFYYSIAITVLSALIPKGAQG